MSENKSTEYFGGVSYLQILTAAFIFCKLAKVTAIASWSWWLVLAPLWGPVVIFLAIAAVAFLLVVLAEIYEAKSRARKRTKEIKDFLNKNKVN